MLPQQKAAKKNVSKIIMKFQAKKVADRIMLDSKPIFLLLLMLLVRLFLGLSSRVLVQPQEILPNAGFACVSVCACMCLYLYIRSQILICMCVANMGLLISSLLLLLIYTNIYKCKFRQALSQKSQLITATSDLKQTIEAQACTLVCLTATYSFPYTATSSTHVHYIFNPSSDLGRR